MIAYEVLIVFLGILIIAVMVASIIFMVCDIPKLGKARKMRIIRIGNPDSEKMLQEEKERCSTCPCCGNKKTSVSTDLYDYPNERVRGIFKKKHYAYWSYRCYDCHARWESDEILMYTEGEKEECLTKPFWFS